MHTANCIYIYILFELYFVNFCSHLIYTTAHNVQGGSLSALLKRAREYDEVLNEFEVADWLIHITWALQHLHSKYAYICNFSI